MSVTVKCCALVPRVILATKGFCKRGNALRLLGPILEQVANNLPGAKPGAGNAEEWLMSTISHTRAIL